MKDTGFNFYEKISAKPIFAPKFGVLILVNTIALFVVLGVVAGCVTPPADVFDNCPRSEIIAWSERIDEITKDVLTLLPQNTIETWITRADEAYRKINALSPPACLASINRTIADSMFWLVKSFEQEKAGNFNLSAEYLDKSETFYNSGRRELDVFCEQFDICAFID